jgi:(p)ppGpp synthase/HD superfamily hydrolase
MMFTTNETIALHRVAEIATIAHSGQLRKDGVTPYILHPARVATMVSHFGGNVEAICSAWLHDTVEDVDDFDITSELKKLPLERATLEKIVTIVISLTKNDSIHPRDAKNADSISRILVSHPEVTLVKICDRIDNLLDMGEVFKNGFRDRYIRESVELSMALMQRSLSCGYGEAWSTLESIINTSI